MRGHRAAGGRNDIGVHRGIVEAEALCLLVGEVRDVTRVCIALVHAECDVRIAVRAADILVEKGLGHELRDARVALVGKRVLAYLVGAGRRYHLLEKLLVGLGFRLHDAAPSEPELDAGDLVAVAIERLIDAYPAIRATPIGRGENFEARNIAPASRVPRAFFA